MQGWIKLHRKLIDWEWFHEPKMVQLFIYLLLSANHEPKLWQGVPIARGQVVTGLASLKAATGLSTQSLRTCLSRLEKSQNLTSKSTNRFRIITICNYETYQLAEKDLNKPANKQLTIKKQAKNNPLTANKNVKKDKNDNNEKKKYRDFVFLTEEEYEKLSERWCLSDLEDKIDALNNYIGSKGKKYKSHYHTLLSWDRKNSADISGQLTFAEKEDAAKKQIQKDRTERIMKQCST